MPVIHGVRVGGVVKPLQLDANDQVIVSVKLISAGNADLAADSSGRLIVVFPQPSWSNPLGVLSSFTNNSLPAGTSTQTIYTIPTSQRMVLQMITYQYTGTITNVTLTPQINRSSTIYKLSRETGIANNEVFKLFPQILLDAGDVIEIVVTAATLNDDLNADVFLNRIE